MRKPLAIDLFCGLGGWTEGLLAEGYHARGFDIEAHEYGDERYPGELILADVMSLHGSQFADAALIVASPPCQEFSYMAMPWSRAKQIARALRGQDAFPEGYTGSRTIAELTALFDACFRIQREASAAAGRHIPMVVENVRGCVPWVGRAAWNYGSYYLWGDVPALMPHTLGAVKVSGMDWNGHPAGSKPVKPDYKAVAFNDARHDLGHKTIAHPNKRDGHPHTKRLTNPAEHGLKRPGISFAEEGFNCTMARELAPSLKGLKYNRTDKDRRQHLSIARKAASAKIAKIPLPLSQWIARTYKPARAAA
jgi:hypothetical protein